MDLYTSDEYLHRKPDLDVEDSAWKAGHVLTALTSTNIDARRICDIGCGAGEVANCISKALPNARVTGFDVSPGAISMANNISGANLTFSILRDLAEFPDYSYDVALALDVLEHVDNYPSFLRSLKKIAHIKILHIPLDMSCLAVACGLPALARRGWGHIHYFSKEVALMALEENGYEIIKIRYTSKYILHLNRELNNRGNMPRLLKSLALYAPRRLLSAVSEDVAARWLGGVSLLVIAR